MGKTTNIIAAIGTFPQDEPVLVRAAQIASAHQATLTIIHVIERLTSFDFASADLRRIQHQIQLDARESIEAAVAKQLNGIAKIDIRIETGKPAKRLTELADEINADLVVMRANQTDSIRVKIIGSTTDQVIRTSQVPVLVVKKTVNQLYQHIVVSIDTADNSAAVVPIVAALCPLAKLSLINVVHMPHQLEAAMMHSGFGKDIAFHRDALIKKAECFLDTMLKTLEYSPKRAATRVIFGDPAISLVRATWNPKVDLIVLAPNSTGMIRRALLGSVAQRVLQEATCDILICRTT